MSQAATHSSPPTRPALGGNLRAKLGAVRRKLVRVEVTRRLSISISIGLLGLVALLGADWFMEFSLETRSALLLALGIVVTLFLLRALVALATQRRDEESIALMVEKNDPGFRSRLIASVQFANGKSSIPDEAGQAMVERMVADTESYARPVRFTEVVNTTPLKRALVVLLLLVTLGTGGYLAGGGITRDLLKRAFLSDIPVPRATRVVWTSGDLTVGIGDPVTIEAVAEGHLPAHGILRIRHASGRKEQIRLSPADDGRSYTATLQNVQESFSYLVALHDGRSDRQRVRALPRPTVTSVVGTQTYPPYTNLSPSAHQPGEFLLFPGSELELTVTASQPLQSGSLRLLGGAATTRSEVDPENPNILRASFAVSDADLTGFTVSLVDTNGMSSRDETVYRLSILSDESPEVRVTRPGRKRELVTPTARVLIAYEAEDRFGIERITLGYRVGSKGTSNAVVLPLANVGTRKAAESYDWDLTTISPLPEIGDEIEFWIEAYDQNAATPAGKSTLQILEVVTPREKRNDLLGRVGDSLGRIEQATSDQERLNDALAEWIRNQPSSGQPLPLPDRNDDEQD